MTSDIRIFGARQNNLQNLDLTIPAGQFLVLTGVSGSGKSSLAFDTLYAEGQRRYVETFSPYARQFLDRMDKPQVDRIEGVLPAIAIDQVNPVRNSRSTVGTMTELNDHLKLLYARAAHLFCRGCGQPVVRDNALSVFAHLDARLPDEDPRLIITFPVHVPANFSEEEVRGFLEQQGYTRIQADQEATGDGKGSKASRCLHVVQDRFRFRKAGRERFMEALETAFRQGRGQIIVYVQHADNTTETWPFNEALHCVDCDITYAQPLPSSFSFNSPLGACETCRGFGRIMGIDYDLVVPDPSRTLREGAIRPLQTPTYQPHQADMERQARQAGIRLDTPWAELDDSERQWVIEGSPDFSGRKRDWKHQWYGMRRFFDWLESRAYRMHVRVLLSKYRSYSPCPDCAGARLKPDAALWRVGAQPAPQADHPLFMPVNAGFSTTTLARLPGLNIVDLMRLPIQNVRAFFDTLDPGTSIDDALALLLTEIRSRLKFLCDVGLGYLSLDRQSRTLSGGEVQRINLTTALGTSLVNTLFVLDEPSIGLHPRDMHRIVGVMQRLKHNGNTLVVVEHDPDVMVAADRILDMGPGPGERGGHIVFDGTPDALQQASTLTGDYLGGRRTITAPRPLPVTDSTPRLILEGVRAHNLKNIDVSIPLERLVCITGVSGSGKSTLVQDVLYPAFLKQRGQPTEAPGPHLHLLGADRVADMVMVDQTPIGKTARSNPASYVGAYDAIRKLFAKAPLARDRGYKPGTFSFNTGDGRCPGCGGTGFEHIEMQFLADVYLRCPDCNGRRFRPEVLEVTVEHRGTSASIADVLDMTVSEATSFFVGLQDIQRGLTPLMDVGLEYLRLGQPVPTLSGGEAQRLKLAGHLAAAARSRLSAARVAKKGTLFLFDEPTTGLHFDDVARLMNAFRKLLDAGHSLLIIEHNLDVIRAADWVIDLGPEGGDAGGTVIATGTPADIMAAPASHTGHALRQDAQRHHPGQSAPHVQEAVPVYEDPIPNHAHQQDHTYPALRSIHIVNAREHNLKNVEVCIPHNTFTVITGVSGSGKSTLAFDILFNEGQRRYLESLNAYARSIVQPAGKPEVDAIYGIAPTVAIEQRTSRGGQKSTVATMTEIYHFLRLLYVRLGTQMCPDCQVPVEPQTPDQIVSQLLADHAGQHVGLLAPLVVARKGYYTDLAKWAAGKGYHRLYVDGDFIPTEPWPRLDRYREHSIYLPVGDLIVDASDRTALHEAVTATLEHGKGTLMVLTGLTDADAGASLTERRKQGIRKDTPALHFSIHRACPGCGTSFPEPDPRMFSYNSRMGWCTHCHGTGLALKGFDAEQTGEEPAWTDMDDPVHPCSHCQGQRLNPVSLAVHWQGRSIADITRLSVADASEFFAQPDLSERDAQIAHNILEETRSRLAFMQRVGLGYLTLDRAAPTLSGGEAQRIRLAAQLGSNLQGVCYVLDEPTIGLHPRDNHILLDALHDLEGHGNTLVVVEHDEDTIRRAEHVIDMGPGAGVRGGQVVAEGSVEAIMANPDSITGRYLMQPLKHPAAEERRAVAQQTMLSIRGAHRHNLRHIDVQIPTARLSVVTGVSGSGKSTLAREVLLDNLSRVVNSREPVTWMGCDGIEGWHAIDRVLEVDQTPIGKTPRSCPATYVGFWDDIRRLFASTRDAQIRGWTATRFSFNTGDGRCAECGGQGMRTIEMNFLPDVKVLCDACQGNRFNPETLSVQWQGKHIGEVLAMDVDEAVAFFASHQRVLRSLKLMQDVGLGYLTLGQPSPTLSGGEAQRIKLVTELVKARLDEGVHRTGRASRSPHTLYVLDEPTVGLSMADVEKLIAVLHRLVDADNTVVVIEHNLDIIAEADWIVDLGPEGGSGGGQLVVQGSPETVLAQAETSHTAAALGEFLQRVVKEEA